MKIAIAGILMAMLLSGTVSHGLEYRQWTTWLKTEEGLNIAIFRNNWDPTAFWKCQQNETAVLKRFPDGTAFMRTVKNCVSWEEWQWEEPVPPTSEPENEYLEIKSKI